jgi:nicotinamidase-related amidase
MHEKNSDLHGNAPDRSTVAIVLIDVINDFEFEGGEEMMAPALAAARRMVELKHAAHEAGVPVIYANDNFGRWRSNLGDVIAHCLQDGVRGRPIVELLQPHPQDYFVLKPKHSAFFSTTMETLLEYLGSRRLIFGGFAGNVCVQFTAQDAFMRDFDLYVPADCLASASAEENERALEYMRRVLGADTTPSAELDLGRLQANPPGRG